MFQRRDNKTWWYKRALTNYKSNWEQSKRKNTRYKVGLIDEFQDTDPVQLRLLKEAFGNRSTHLLLMIGDPKQAIYSFRGGSLNTYMKARERCDRIDLMNTNYGSTKSLILLLSNFLGSINLSRSE